MKIGRLLLFGILIWIIPFITGFFFYDAEGNLATDIFLFKSIMIVMLVLAGALFSILYLKKMDSSHVQKGVIAGVSWLVISILLDALVLIPMTGMSGVDYVSQIGLRYLTLPITVITAGIAFSQRHGE